jgi:hypothetical protein
MHVYIIPLLTDRLSAISRVVIRRFSLTQGVHCSNWFLSDDARWACLEESIARSSTVISLLLQSSTHCRYRVYTEFLLTYTAIYRSNRKVLPLGITALQLQAHFHLGTLYSTTYAHYVLDNKGYRPTLKWCIILTFCTAKMVTWMRLNIRFIRTYVRLVSG